MLYNKILQLPFQLISLFLNIVKYHLDQLLVQKQHYMKIILVFVHLQGLLGLRHTLKIKIKLFVVGFELIFWTVWGGRSNSLFINQRERYWVVFIIRRSQKLISICKDIVTTQLYHLTTTDSIKIVVPGSNMVRVLKKWVRSGLNV